jgi:hypothetical protein
MKWQRAPARHRCLLRRQGDEEGVGCWMFSHEIDTGDFDVRERILPRALEESDGRALGPARWIGAAPRHDRAGQFPRQVIQFPPVGYVLVVQDRSSTTWPSAKCIR